MMGNRPQKSTQTKESELLYIYKQVQLDIYVCVFECVCGIRHVPGCFSWRRVSGRWSGQAAPDGFLIVLIKQVTVLNSCLAAAPPRTLGCLPFPPPLTPF